MYVFRYSSTFPMKIIIPILKLYVTKLLYTVQIIDKMYAEIQYVSIIWVHITKF